MPYKSGTWGREAQIRNKKRLKYFAEHNYKRNHGLLKKRTDLGYIGEEEALKILNGSIRYSREIDLIWNGKKIDVKTATVCFEGKYYNHPRWRFTITPQKGKCDYFIFICKNKTKETRYIFIIPDKEISNKISLTITETKVNKFKKYRLKVR